MNYNKIIYFLKLKIDGCDKTLWNKLKQSNAMIAGGSLLSIVQNTQINDFDIYFRNRANCYKFITSLEGSWACVCKTERSAVFKLKHTEIALNVIFFDTFNSLEDIFIAFDYECCKIGYDFKNKCLSCSDVFWHDLCLKRLTYSGASRYPLGALVRMQKYIKKGFTIEMESILKLVKDLSPIVSMPIDKVIDQLSGMYGLEIDKTSITDFNSLILAFQNGVINEKKGTYVGDKIEWDDIFKDLFTYYRIGSHHNGGVTMLDGEIISSGNTPMANCKPLQFPIIAYKKVNDDGTSHYRNSFRYNVGEIAKDTNHGLYCCLNKSMVPKYDFGGSVLECIIPDVSDIVEIRNDCIRVKKMFVKSITPNKIFEEGELNI